MRSSLSMAILAVACVAPSLVGAAPLFENGAIFTPVPATPSRVAAADFDGDGKRDLFVSHSGSGMVSLLRGNGDGTLQLVQQVASGPGAGPLAAGDLNGDGRDDAVCTNAGSGSHSLTVLVATSGGVVPQSLGLPLTPVDAKLGHFDSDGSLDLLVLLGQTPQIGWCRGLGDGTFDPYVLLATLPSSGRQLELADLDRDGELDALALLDAKLAVGYGTGTGQVRSPLAISNVPSQPEFPTVSPNPMRLRRLASGSTEVWVYDLASLPSSSGYQIGEYSAGAVTFHLSTTSPVTPFFDFVDVNGDAWPDMIADASIHLGSSAAAAGPANPTFGGSGVLTADMNGDGHPDLIGTACLSVTVALLTPIDPTTVIAGHGRSYGGPQGAYAFGDLDQDGHADAVAVSNQEIWLWRGSTNGSFSAPTRQSSAGTSVSGELSLVDITGDGRLDLLSVLGTEASDIQVLPNLGGGVFGPRVVLDGPSSWSALSFGDLNNDGRGDVVGRNALPQILVYTGNTDGSLTLRATYSSTSINDLKLGHMDGDGKLDMIVAKTAGAIEWWPGNGNGTFQASTEIGSPVAWSVAIADLDGDGNNDVLIGTANQLHWLRNSGTGFLSAAQLALDAIPTNGLVQRLAVQDLDVDGRADASFYSGDFSGCGCFAARGQGNGTFQLDGIYARGIPKLPRALRVDSDSDLDLAFGVGSGFAVLQGLTQPNPVHVGEIQSKLELSPVVPTPSRAAARFTFELPRRSRVVLEVLDLAGRRVALLENDVLEGGRHQRIWGGEGRTGRRVASGVYIVRLRADEGELSRRMILTN